MKAKTTYVELSRVEILFRYRFFCGCVFGFSCSAVIVVVVVDTVRTEGNTVPSVVDEGTVLPTGRCRICKKDCCRTVCLICR
jgi:hypothetical protein